MKIALVSTPFVAVPPRDYGGTELVVHELAEGLVARGHDVTLFATGDSRTSARLEALYDVAQWPPHSLAELDHVSWAMGQIRAGDFDIVHAHLSAALALGRLVTGPPLVYTVHHDRDEALTRYYRAFPWAWYVFISRRQLELEDAPPRSTVIHHGIDAAPYGGESPGDEGVCYIGRLSQVKAPHLAIDAAERAGVTIRVAGRIHDDGDDPGYVERELHPRLEREHVDYVGPVGMDRKVRLLLRSRALLLPIEWEEPFGLIMVEAMLAGCPVIAFARGSAPELVEDGRTGFLVRDVEEMAEVVRTRLQDFDREACRARAAERFGRDRMVAAHEAHYERARKARPRGAASMAVSA